jgi:hypothetical protein
LTQLAHFQRSAANLLRPNGQYCSAKISPSNDGPMVT